MLKPWILLRLIIEEICENSSFFYILQRILTIFQKADPNYPSDFIIGKKFILWLFSKYALKIPKNDPKKVKISICSLLEGISEKVAENIPPTKSKFRGGILFHIYSKIPFEGLKIKILSF